jgi:ABC-type lipoprotein export system ATPase subunit
MSPLSEATTSSSSGTPRLLVRGLSKGYPGLPVLRGLDLSVEGSEVVAIRGQSGTGKSTLLHCLGLLDQPDSGSIQLDGEEVTGRSIAATASLRATRIGFVFQAFHLLPEFTVGENVLMAGRTARMAPIAAHARMRELLTRVGLETRERADVRTLSGGERQRVALCRALLTRPALLLADEPTGNLDPLTAGVVLELLLGLARAEGSSVILVTHDPAIAERADRRLALRDGVLQAV